MLRLARMLCGLCCFSALASAGAQPKDIARFSGSRQAMAELCGDKAALAKLQQKQERAMQHSGMSPAEYQAEFQRGYAQSQEDFAGLSEEEKAKTCAQLQAFSRHQKN